MPQSKRPRENKCHPALIESHFHILLNQISSLNDCLLNRCGEESAAETLKVFLFFCFQGCGRWKSAVGLVSGVDVSCFPSTILMEGNIPHRERQIPPFHFPADKLYNNHSVSWSPPWLRFQFCTIVPRRSHESTLNFCSRQRSSALQCPFDSLPLKLFLKGWKIILWLRYPSLAATCGSSHMALWCMSDEASEALGFCNSSPSSTLLPTFWGTGDSFVLVNLSLCWEKRGCGEQPMSDCSRRKMCSAVSFVWVNLGIC